MDQAFNIIKTIFRRKIKLAPKIGYIDGNFILNNEKSSKRWKQSLEILYYEEETDNLNRIITKIHKGGGVI
jgi:hypothetical protein